LYLSGFEAYLKNWRHFRFNQRSNRQESKTRNNLFDSLSQLSKTLYWRNQTMFWN